MKIKRYKVIYSVTGYDFNIRYVECSDFGNALREFKSKFPEAFISEMIEV